MGRSAVYAVACAAAGVAGALLIARSSEAADPARSAKIAFLRPSLDGDSAVVSVVRADGTGRHRSTLPAAPYFAPGGRKLAYFVKGPPAARLYVADRDGKSRRLILRTSVYYSCLDPAWSPDARALLYTLDCDVDFQRIGRVNADGTGRRMLTGTWSMNPSWSPDGRTIAFTSTRRPPAQIRWGLYLMDADGRRRRRIPGRYPMAEPTPNSAPAWSRDGRRIFFLTWHGEELFAIGSDGSRARSLVPSLAKVRDFELSPDGRKLVLAAPGRPDRGWEIYTVRTDGSELRRLTDNRAHDAEPTWSPDGRKIAFTSGRDGNSEIYVMNADGSGQANLSRSPADEHHPIWVPAGSGL